MYLNQIKSTPWEWVCDMTDSFRAMTVQIGFSHRENETDETEFCIDTFNDQELAELFDAFCKENDFEDVKVNYISVVRVAASMDELIEEEECRRFL